MQPMNYTIDAGNTGNSFAQGFQNMSGMMATAAEYQRNQQLMTIAQQKAEAEQQKRRDFQEVAQNPTRQGYQRLATLYPELHEGVSKASSMMNDGERRIVKELGGSLAIALTKGKNDAAVGLIDQYIESAKNSGDQANLERFEMLRNSVVANPNGALFGLHGIMMGVMDGKEYADWSKGVEEAEKMRQTRGADVRKAEADATTAETKAQYAGQDALADIEKKGWDIKKIRADIDNSKFDQRIKVMEAQLKREDSEVKRQELSLKIEEARSKKDEAVRMKAAEADTAISSIKTTQTLLSDVLADEDTLRAATGVSAWRGSIPGTESRAMAGKLEQLQNALAAENLDRLKGAMSDKDIMFIKNISANLDRYQDEEKLIGELKRVQKVMADAEARTLKKYGKEKEPEAAPVNNTDARLKALNEKYLGKN